MALILTADERTELERRTRSRKIRSEDGRRAHVILMLADGDSFATIAGTLGCSPDYINRWRRRFQSERMPGLRAKFLSAWSASRRFFAPRYGMRKP